VLPRYDLDEPGTHPPLLYPDYRSTLLRAPRLPPVDLEQRLTEVTGPLFGADRVGELDHDLTRQHAEEPQGQRIIVFGRVLDAYARPVPDTLLEIWQANASGRYRHAVDNWPAPLDPNFTGLGRTTTDQHGNYRFLTIKPGAYPWGNHRNAWRPAHIHFSLFGRAFTQRLITQMYFPDDPLFDHDPIFNSVRDPSARRRLVSTFRLDATEPSWALAFQFDIVLRGRDATPFEEGG
jgi:protocatechuate 3,4-dioxygenase beta subunit